MLAIVEESGVDSGEPGVLTLFGVVTLTQDHGRELRSGGDLDAGFADGFELAVELDGSGAVAVAEQWSLHLDPQSAHLIRACPDRSTLCY